MSRELSTGHLIHPEPSERSSSPGIAPLWFFAMLLAMLAGIFLIWSFQFTDRLYGSDWQTFYLAAQRLRVGHRIYTVADGFFNPPPFLLLVLPFTLLPYIPSRVLWAALCLVMLLAAAALSASVVGWRPSGRARFQAIWWLIWYLPTILLAPITGNFSALVVLGLALACWFFYRGRQASAGIALALTLVKPQLAFLTLPFLLYTRRWRAAAAYLLAVLVAFGLTLPMVGWQSFLDYVDVQTQVSKWTHTNNAMQLDVPGIHGMFLQQWPQNGVAEVLADLCSLALVAALAWLWRGPWQVRDRDYPLRWSALVLVTLLVASFAHTYDLTLLILPAVVLYGLSQNPDAGLALAQRWTRPLLVALYIAPGLALVFKQHFLVPPLLAALLLCWRLAESSPAGTTTRKGPVTAGPPTAAGCARRDPAPEAL